MIICPKIWEATSKISLVGEEGFFPSESEAILNNPDGILQGKFWGKNGGGGDIFRDEE